VRINPRASSAVASAAVRRQAAACDASLGGGERAALDARDVGATSMSPLGAGCSCANTPNAALAPVAILELVLPQPLFFYKTQIRWIGLVWLVIPPNAISRPVIHLPRKKSEHLQGAHKVSLSELLESF
jgi:hypothetical protein